MADHVQYILLCTNHYAVLNVNQFATIQEITVRLTKEIKNTFR